MSYDGDYSQREYGNSKFNEANYQIERLHDIWRYCRAKRREGNLYAWRWALEDVWLELCYDALRLEGENTTENKYYQQKKTYEKIISHIIGSRNNRALMQVLLDYQQFLYILQNKAGKGGLYTEPEEIVF